MSGEAYGPTHNRRRQWLTSPHGFTGSAGLAIVVLDSAALFTDGRYFLQASQQLDSNWTLMKSGLPEVPTWQEYLVKVWQSLLLLTGTPVASTVAPSSSTGKTDLSKHALCLSRTSLPVPELVSIPSSSLPVSSPLGVISF